MHQHSSFLNECSRLYITYIILSRSLHDNGACISKYRYGPSALMHWNIFRSIWSFCSCDDNRNCDHTLQFV